MFENYKAESFYNRITTKRVEIGNIISYKLLPSQKPTNPDKLWRGKIIKYANGFMLVELVEPGYVGLTELVKAEQIVSIDEFIQKQAVGE